MQVIKLFTCDVAELLDFFADEMYEPSWSLEEGERRKQLLQSLERTMRSEHQSLTQHELHVPDMPPPDELPPTPDWRERLALASEDQLVVIDVCMKHFELPEPDAPELLALHGCPGAGKSFVLNIILDAARDAGHACVPCAYPTKVAVTFKGGNTVHFQLGLPRSKPNEPIEMNMAAPDTAGGAGARRARALRALVRRARFVFIDEMTMMCAEQLDALVALIQALGFVGAAPTDDAAILLPPLLRDAFVTKNFQLCTAMSPLLRRHVAW